MHAWPSLMVFAPPAHFACCCWKEGRKNCIQCQRLRLKVETLSLGHASKTCRRGHSCKRVCINTLHETLFGHLSVHISLFCVLLVERRLGFDRLLPAAGRGRVPGSRFLMLLLFDAGPAVQEGREGSLVGGGFVPSAGKR
jgi:hypothetical protein